MRPVEKRKKKRRKKKLEKEERLYGIFYFSFDFLFSCSFFPLISYVFLRIINEKKKREKKEREK